MTRERIEYIANDLFNKCTELRKNKGTDYSQGNVDVLANFKKEAGNFGTDPKLILGVYMNKHFSAINNYIKSNGQSESEPINMRICDAINYLILLQGLIQDEKETVDKE